jgi:hypothetical protein
MEPLDLRSTPPRSPRAKLAGIVFTARLVDKLRASLSGGDLNGYFPFVGFSEVWSHYTAVDLHELRDVVAAAPSERDVERWLEDRTATVDRERVNDKMQRFETSRTPPQYLATFEATYPAELRRAHDVIFEMLDADDARLYQTAGCEVHTPP